MNTTVPATLFRAGLPYRTFLFIASFIYSASFLLLLTITGYLVFGISTCGEILIRVSSLLIKNLHDRSLFGEMGNTWLIILLIAATILLGEASQQWRNKVFRNGLFLLYVGAAFMSVVFYFLGTSEMLFPEQNFSTITFTGEAGIGAPAMPTLTIELVLREFCRGFAMVSFSIAFAKVILVHAAVLLKNNIFMAFTLALSFSLLCNTAQALNITIKHSNGAVDNQATLTVTRASHGNPKKYDVNHDNNPHFQVTIPEADLYSPLLFRFETKREHSRSVEFYTIPFRARISGPCPILDISEYTNLSMRPTIIKEYLDVQQAALEVSPLQVQRSKAELFKKRFIDMYSIVEELLNSQRNDNSTNLFYLIYLDLAYTYNILDVHSDHPHEQPHNIIIPTNYERVYNLISARLDDLAEDNKSRVAFLNHMAIKSGIGEKTMKSILKQAKSLCGENIFNSIIYMHNYWRAIAQYTPENYDARNTHKERILNLCAYNAKKTLATLPDGTVFETSPEGYFRQMFSTVRDNPKFTENSALQGEEFVRKNFWKEKD